ncbi:unnamed protein product, partial [Notodromas monacha]
TFQDAVPGWVYEFSVSASTSAGQGQQTAPFILTLEQNVPARIASWGTNLETTVGSSLLLECLRFGLPNPNLTWGDEYNTLINFNDRVVAKDDGSLVISDVTRGDSGKYTCNVANSHGNDAITYSITVRISRAGKDVRSPIILDDLRPATAYELSIRAVSEAGETVFQHRFFTLNILGVAVAGEASVKGDSDGPSFSDVRIMTPTILSIVAVAVTVASVYVFLRR